MCDGEAGTNRASPFLVMVSIDRLRTAAVALGAADIVPKPPTAGDATSAIFCGACRVNVRKPS